MKGEQTFGEGEFEQAAGELSESISGSDSEDGSEEEDLEPTKLETIAEKKGVDLDDGPTTKRQKGPGRPPLTWFNSSLFPTNVSLGIYNTIFDAAEQATPLEALKAKQLSGEHTKNPSYFLCLLGGGHFAAMIVSLVPKKGQGERQAEVLRHKTFHRYTTRRKQGGAQSTSDAAKGAAHSAGSSLRRHNEMALMGEIRELLEEWKPLIDDCERVFVRATGNTNRRVLFGYEGAVLNSKDERLRGFPFSTRRATQREAMRCFQELTRIKVSYLTEDALATTQPTAPTPAAVPKKAPKQEEDPLIAHSTQITTLVKRAKVPALLSYLATNSLSSNFIFVPPQHHAPTPLHLAASLSLAPVVTALLTKASADPTLTNEGGKTAYEIAGDRATRDAFRLARGTLGEEACDWDKASVPVPLSKRQIEMREEKERKEKEKEAEKEKERKKLVEEQLLQEEKAKAASAKRSQAGRPLVVGMDREMQTRGLSEEAKRRLERERRARAAEERIARMQRGEF